MTAPNIRYSSESFAGAGYEGPVLKLSKRGCIFHRRYLEIEGNFIRYYRKKPGSEATTPTPKHAKAKAQLDLHECSFAQVDTALARKKKRSCMFYVTSLSAAAKSVTWYFAVEDGQVLGRWLHALDSARKERVEHQYENEADLIYQRELERVRQEEQAMALQLAQDQEAERHRKSAEERKRKQEADGREHLKIERQKQKEDREKERQKRRELLEEQERQRKKDEIEAQRRSKYQKLLATSWDYRFQKIWSQCINTCDNFEGNLKSGIMMFTHIGKFRARALEYAQAIIEEFHLPMEKRRFHPIEESGTSLYACQNLLVRLVWEAEESPMAKVLGYEFRASDVMTDALFLLSRQEKNFKIRVPLCCVVDYRGFRALVLAAARIDGEKTLIHGPNTEGTYQANLGHYKHLSYISQLLNLKEHKFEWDDRISPAYIHLSAFCQLHKSLGYEELEDYVRDNMGDDEIPEAAVSLGSIYYLTNLADILPVDADVFDKRTPNFLNRLRPEFFCEYRTPLSADAFINISEENAIADDVEVVEAGRDLRHRQIPALVKALDSLQVMPIDSKSMKQAFHSYGVNMRYLGRVAEQTSLPHIRDITVVEMVAQVCKKLLRQQYIDLVFDQDGEVGFDQEEEIGEEVGLLDVPKAGGVTKNNMTTTSEGSEGSNGSSTRPYTSATTIEIESLNTLSFHMSIPTRKRAYSKRNLQLQPHQMIDDTTDDISRRGSVTTQSGDEAQTSEITDFDLQCKECAIDFLNLVFGCGEDNDLFWNEILVRKVVGKYGVSQELLDKNGINLHALLHAICFHCHLVLYFTKETQVGKVEFPFTLESLEEIRYNVKTFSMKNVEYRILSDRYVEYKEAQKHELALQSCYLRLKISKALNQDPGYYGEPSLLGDIGEILLETEDFEGAMKVAREGLVQTHPLHAETIKCWSVLIRAFMMKAMIDEALQCFESALEALEYHWGPYHPLHSTIYSILAFHYMEKTNYEDARELYKQSLLNSLRVLGPNHPNTADVYLELGNLYVNMKMIPDALGVFEKGYLAYEANLGKRALPTVNAGFQLAQLMTRQGRYAEAIDLITEYLSVHDQMIGELQVELEDDVSVEPKIDQHREKQVEALRVGLTAAQRLERTDVTCLFAEKMWTLLSTSLGTDRDRDVCLTAVASIVKAATPPDRLALLITAVLNTRLVDASKVGDPTSLAGLISRAADKGGVEKYLTWLINEIIFTHNNPYRDEVYLEARVDEFTDVLHITGESLFLE